MGSHPSVAAHAPKADPLVIAETAVVQKIEGKTSTVKIDSNQEIVQSVPIEALKPMGPYRQKLAVISELKFSPRFSVLGR